VKPTDQSLLEQMRVNAMEISRRKNMLSFSEADAELLKGAKGIILKNIDDIVGEFYETQTAIDEIALLIGDADTLHRLKMAQRKYILDLFDGYYDLEYVNNRLRIGLVHKRIGVEPTLYLSAVNTMKSIICRVLGENIPDNDHRWAISRALDRLIYFDITLVFDTYIRSLLSEIEVSRMKAELYARSLEEQVAERTQQLEEISRRDGMTGLYNVRAFHEYLRRDLLSAERSHLPLSLIYFDVDNFKGINDTHGHQKGDDILKNVAKVLNESCREVDVPCRYGGDEFCLVLAGAGLDEARVTAERIIAKFKAIYDDVTLSIGIAETGVEHYLDGDGLIRVADQKMYQAKATEGSCIAT